MSEANTEKANLYLVGFMGTGKSAVGRNLAHSLGLRFIDSDYEIEKRMKMSVQSIFEELGELGFRHLEREFIENGHPERGCVVSCGGGLVMQPGMVDMLKERGVVICLFASVETILKRTSKTRKRPLLEVEDPTARIKELLDARYPMYLQAGKGITTENRTIGEVADHAARIYRAEAERFSS